MLDDILWLVTARAGSKGIPNKNIKELNGIPLMSYRIMTALSLSPRENVWVSTDSIEYCEVAKKWGAQVPFLRPNELSSDESSSVDVVLHAMNYAETIGRKFNYIGLLEPTSPFVYIEDILAAINQLKSNEEYKTVIAVRESRPNTMFIQDKAEYLDKISERICEMKNIGRKNFKMEITPSGGFYIAKWSYFLKTRNFYTSKSTSYLLPEESSLEIDELIDWLWAEFLIEKKIIDITKLFNIPID
ncbi:MAG: hypothetical protein BGO30_02840 [Bacteroidetes bacterium 41-46]|nr:MAG: hypothetical protein BGO30_02840 [Bacteroidetes bacterium 41-46]